MGLERKGRQAVQKALAEVRELAQEALVGGHFDALEQLAAMARRLEPVAEAPGSINSELALGDAAGRGSSNKARAEVGASEKYTKQAQAQGAQGSKRKRRTRAPSPRFYRRGTDLVKVGIAKAGGNYEHKAPAHVLEALVTQFERLATSETPVRMDGLLPKLADVAGREIPSYQAYLCLAWLRAEGLVVQHGRRGYTLAASGPLSKAAEERFKALRTQR